MRLYTGTTQEFISDSTHNRIAEKLKQAFFSAYRHNASISEIKSWQNSLRALSQVFQSCDMRDNGVLLEYELPLTSKRLDCLITGLDENNKQQAAIIELKQWEKCEIGDSDKVVTFVGGNYRDVLHPSVQVGQYRRYLQHFQPVFYEEANPIGLKSCSYLHNYIPDYNDPLFADQYKPYFTEDPVFTADNVDKLSEFLKSSIKTGDDQEGLRRILAGKFKPSKKLMQNVGSVLEGKEEYILLDEQLVAFSRVLSAAKGNVNSRNKTTVLIIGGPGTGKSVIALNLHAALSKDGIYSNYVTGSKAFTETLRKVVGSIAGNTIKYFNSYMKSDPNEIDVMICDESHRIRVTSSNQWTKAVDRSDKSQIQELYDASKVLVFFVDDKQVVRPGEIGSSAIIREAANINNSTLFEYKLESQFRCAGSETFINWIENTLELERNANVIWNLSDAKFEFKILSTPEELDFQIQSKISEGYSARLLAGFCWPWSDPLSNGFLVNDLKIGSFERPWNAKSTASRIHPSIPKESLWAYDPRGVHQIGCVYTAQGFEFDYAGVIIGRDLVYRSSSHWVGQKEYSQDSVVKKSKDNFLSLVKNTYRVLLSRAMKGCYVYFEDKETEMFFRSRTEDFQE